MLTVLIGSLLLIILKPILGKRLAATKAQHKPIAPRAMIDFNTDVEFCTAGQHVFGCFTEGKKLSCDGKNGEKCSRTNTSDCPLMMWNFSAFKQEHTLFYEAEALGVRSYLPSSVSFHTEGQGWLRSSVISRHVIKECQACAGIQRRTLQACKTGHIVGCRVGEERLCSKDGAPCLFKDCTHDFYQFGKVVRQENDARLVDVRGQLFQIQVERPACPPCETIIKREGEKEMAANT